MTIELKNISFAYQENQVLKDFSLFAKDGECMAIVGQNGAGKSTLLKLMVGILKPSKGDVFVDGINLWRKRKFGKAKVISDHASRIGYVMQRPERQLFADTIADDIAFGPKNLGFEPDKIEKIVKKWIDFFDLGDVADMSPYKVSGGQQRKAAIAGVVACETQNICMDEPSASLDSDSSEKNQSLIKRLKEDGKCVILVSHDMQEVEKLANHVIEIKPLKQKVQTSEN